MPPPTSAATSARWRCGGIPRLSDLRSGATATFAHGLAAAYLGFTVAFGHVTIQWADRRFAHHFAGAPALPPPPTHGRSLVLYELKWWARCGVAVLVTIGLCSLAILVVDDPERTAELEIWLRLPIVTFALWFAFGPAWALVFG